MIARIRGRHVSRLEGFSDAVFAFSATLLVVSLQVPNTYRELVSDLYGFVAFGLSFAVLVLIWSIHNAFFRRYGLQDGWTVVLNAVLLFVVLFYVYPLKFVSKGFVGTVLGIGPPTGAGGGQVMLQNIDELGSLFVLYGVGFITVFLCFALFYRHAHARRGDLDLSELDDFYARFYFRQYMLFVMVGVTSVALAWWGLGLKYAVPGWVYGALGPLCLWHGLASDRRRPRQEDAAEGD